jgi:deoxyribose-phosphate aldolase
MKRTVRYKADVKVKASGGIRTAERCMELLRAGADRIGTYV